MGFTARSRSSPGRSASASPPTSTGLISQSRTYGLLDGATQCLGKLHAHLNVLQPGAGYEPHRDAYDVAIVMLDGTVETLGKRIGPISVAYFAVGALHRMKNVGTEPARYVVFEFHASESDVASLLMPPSLLQRAASKLLRGGRRLARRLRPQ